jgi:protein-S-isoprenylcysteine O-methyltransferase Ste14
MVKPIIADHKLWWKGSRGEWFVVAQVILIALVFLGPRTVGGQPLWTFPFPQACAVLGAVLMVLGGVLFFSGIVYLGRGLTPLPYPREGAKLIESGPFALVRHPIYSGGLVLCLGWALYVQGWLTLGYVIALLVILDAKARREEKWLVERFPAYAMYQQQVRKLIPFIY